MLLGLGGRVAGRFRILVLVPLPQFHVNTISKALWQSASPILTCRSTRSGSSFEIIRIRSGWDGKNYSSASAGGTQIFNYGTNAL